jgi:pyruvate dehydrogenase E2 component (dihydrolipoamide acetyltransferase)
VGLAIATEDGLVVATVTNPDHFGLAELVSTVQELVTQARSGPLRAQDLAPAAVTLSNLGMFRVDRFTATIDPDQTALIAAGRVRGILAFANGEVIEVPTLDLTVTADHRTVDGAEVARFLDTLADTFER